MTFKFRLRLWWTYVVGWMSGGIPIYIRDSTDTYIRLARWKYDPWIDEKYLVTKNNHGIYLLRDDGMIGHSQNDYSTTKWRYVSKSRRVMQQLKQG